MQVQDAPSDESLLQLPASAASREQQDDSAIADSELQQHPQLRLPISRQQQSADVESGEHSHRATTVCEYANDAQVSHTTVNRIAFMPKF